jgi:hypothetical protein
VFAQDGPLAALGCQDRRVRVILSELRKKRLRALARLHTTFVTGHLDAPFHPEGRLEGSDYNQHSVDLEAPVDAQDAFRERALAIVHGDVDDEL